jgi:hypothetical protein
MLVWFAVMQAFFILLFTQIKLTNTAKTRDLENRFNDQVAATAPAVNLVANGGTVGGDVHVQGVLYGTGGTLTIGDTAQFTATGNGPTGSNTFLGMTNSQATFLDSLSQMSSEGAQTLGTSGFGGGVWTASQTSALLTLQTQMNGGIGGLNNLISRLQSDGYMSP